MKHIDETEIGVSGNALIAIKWLQNWLGTAVANGATHFRANVKLVAYGIEKKKLLTPEKALELFGDPKNANTYKWMRLWTPPAELADKAPGFPKRIYMHVIAIPLWEKIYAQLIEQELIREIYSIGWYNVRLVSGTTKWSLHSWALGPDINPGDNPRGSMGKMNPRIVEIFENNGFNWGGRWSNPDPMHYELSLNAVEEFLTQNTAMIVETEDVFMPMELRISAAVLAERLSGAQLAMQEFESSFGYPTHDTEQNC